MSCIEVVHKMALLSFVGTKTMSVGVRVAKFTNVVMVAGRSIVLPVTGVGAPTRSVYIVLVTYVRRVPLSIDTNAPPRQFEISSKVLFFLL